MTGSAAAVAHRRLRGWLPRWPRRRGARRALVAVMVLCLVPIVALGGGCGALLVEDTGTIAPNAHTTGDDALWLGHAWVDGRKDQADVDALAAKLRATGIRDLFVHTGPLSDKRQPRGCADRALDQRMGSGPSMARRRKRCRSCGWRRVAPRGAPGVR
jgi:hypothetical protein